MLANVQADFLDQGQVFDQPAETLEDLSQGHRDKVPVLQGPEQQRFWRLAVEMCY